MDAGGTGGTAVEGGTGESVGSVGTEETTTIGVVIDEGGAVCVETDPLDERVGVWAPRKHFLLHLPLHPQVTVMLERG